MTNAWRRWFDEKGWTPFPFQEETWDAFVRGESGLVHAPTGFGKTHAAWGGPVQSWLARKETKTASRLRVLWITPMRALANDTAENLREPLAALGIPWTVELRTGDTTAAVRRRQRDRLPDALVTTPESISLLLSYGDQSRHFGGLEAIVVDEWHELLGTKRGVQTELCLARLRRLAPEVRTWGLSATLGNIEEARDVLLGPGRPGRLVRGDFQPALEVETICPESVERFPWSGHLGIKLLPQVLDVLERGATTLLFTNTRSQAEIWFRRLVDMRPEWIGDIALHHGSIDRELRETVEGRLRDGSLRCVVATSSLDLGVDFSPVDQVIQIGSPKGIARFLQRAGRSGHQPGALSRVYGVPTNALELVEYAAVREAVPAVLAGTAPLEQRTPVTGALDVLAQHVVSMGLGDAVDPDELRDDARASHAFHELPDHEWQWVLDFVTRGGATLGAYPEFARLTPEASGRLAVSSAAIEKRHRMTIGTITSHAMMRVKFRGGAFLGTIEEAFISRLAPGDRFVFAGRAVELVRVREMTAYVRRAASTKGIVPRWMGGRSPLSTQLSDAVREKLDAAARGVYDGSEMTLVRPLLELQAAWSRIPARDELLIERARYGGVQYVFVFSFGGRLVHEGLSALVAHRITRDRPLSIRVTANDFGFELSSRDPLVFPEAAWRRLLTPDDLVDDLLACLNATQLARRRFRGIAQIAGLVFPGFPGQPKTSKQIQASSDLFYDVFDEFDPSNRFLDQARREVLERELEATRLRATLEKIRDHAIHIVETPRFSPLAFPLWADQMRSQQLSSERWIDRVTKMAERLEVVAGRQKAMSHAAG